MSRDIQLANVGGLPVRGGDDGWGSSSMALGAPLQAAPPQQAPLMKIHRMMRGRYILAIIIGLVLGLIGAYFGFTSTKPQYASSGYVEIQPIQINPLGSDRQIAMYTAFLQSQAQLLTKERVVELAMSHPLWRETGRGGAGDDEALRDFKENLTVATLRNSFFIQVQFLDPDATVAQKAVNAILAAFEPISKEEGIGASKTRIDVLQKRVQQNTTEITRLTNNVRDLSKEYLTDDLKAWHDAQLNEMVKWKAKWTETLVQLGLAESMMALQKEGSPEASKLTIEQIKVADPQMRKLIVQRDDWENEVKRLRAQNLGENHVRVRNAKYELQLASEQIEKYAEEFRQQYQSLQSAPDGQGGMVLKSIEQLKVEEEHFRSIYEKAKEDFTAIAQQFIQIKTLNEDIQKLREENEEFNQRIDELNVQASIGGSMRIFPADRPVSYAVDKRKQYAAAGFVGGFGLPFAIFLLIGFFDSRYRYSEEAGTDMSGINLLGILPNLPDLLTDPEQAAIAAHCVHQIRTMLQINGGGDERRVFAVTSASPGDGKTSLTLALGLSFAASGSRTLIIDCDLVGAGLTTRMNMASDEGVLEAIANRSLLEYIRTTDISDLAILPVGSAQAHHASLLSPAALRRLVTEATKHFETILIDTGPILGSIEASSVAAAVDGVILTVARGQQRPLVEKSLAHLKSIGARLAGVVFNRAQARDFERSVSRMSMRSVPTRNGNGNGHGHGEKNALAPANRFGPVARAVASSVKPAGNEENGHADS